MAATMAGAPVVRSDDRYGYAATRHDLPSRAVFVVDYHRIRTRILARHTCRLGLGPSGVRSVVVVFHRAAWRASTPSALTANQPSQVGKTSILCRMDVTAEIYGSGGPSGSDGKPPQAASHAPLNVL